ncbi:MAG: hypothetical protein BWX49_00812 [Bacteroidetes bacterium ADurb.Bin008]|nr:MAG: hypothetical protein BWX49_00812 [Bacteroidetes bacterium ADurb.Bin008]
MAIYATTTHRQNERFYCTLYLNQKKNYIFVKCDPCVFFTIYLATHSEAIVIVVLSGYKPEKTFFTALEFLSIQSTKDMRLQYMD